MRSALIAMLVGLPAAGLWAADGEKPSPPRLGEPVELMKLPKDQVPPMTFAGPFVRVSPTGDRCIYLRRAGSAQRTMLYIRQLGTPKEFAPPTAVHAPLRCWLWGFFGRCWRADGRQVAYLLAGHKDGGVDEPVRYRLGATRFDWSLPLDQEFGGGLGANAKRSHTAVSFDAAGKGFWRAESDLRHYGSCRVLGPKGVVYEGKGFAIHHVVPSPDGRHVAWAEMPPWPKRRRSGLSPAEKERAARMGQREKAPPPPTPAIVILDVATRKVVRRIALSRYSSPWPLWAGGGKRLCYGEISQIRRVYRREIKALRLADGTTRVVLRDARPIGALGRWLVANRGPACIPMTQHTSSYAPPPGTDPRPKRDEIVLCDLETEAAPRTLLVGAFAQQLVGRDLVYARKNGPDVVVSKAPLK
jgi:hypothetical protein